MREHCHMIYTVVALLGTSVAYDTKEKKFFYYVDNDEI